MQRSIPETMADILSLHHWTIDVAMAYKLDLDRTVVHVATAREDGHNHRRGICRPCR